MPKKNADRVGDEEQFFQEDCSYCRYGNENCICGEFEHRNYYEEDEEDYSNYDWEDNYKEQDDDGNLL